MSLFGNYNNARAVTDPDYAWETAATQSVIHQLNLLNRQLTELRQFLAGDLGEVLVALYNLLNDRLPPQGDS